MQKDYERLYHELELTHWWFLGRRHAIITMLSRFPKDARILEVGCSGGALLLDLKKQEFRNAEGLDISSRAINVCRKRGLNNITLASAEQSGKESNSFDVIVAADILEHITDEKIALQEWWRVLKPKGTLILFVPAFSLLWSGHDVVNHHFRRYRKKQLITILTRHGFTIEQASYWNFLLFFPTLAVRLYGRFFASQNEPHPQLFFMPSLLNAALAALLKIENYLLLKIGVLYPVGVSVLVLAKKR